MVPDLLIQLQGSKVLGGPGGGSAASRKYMVRLFSGTRPTLTEYVM